MKIFVHTLVYNEENFVWFAVRSVVDFVDKVMIWDSGSTDKTVKIIKYLQREFPKKIEFREVGRVGRVGVTEMRQKMLEESHCDWIIILDGDEIWPKESIKKILETIKQKGTGLDAIIVPFRVLLGDIYHYQEEMAGQYELAGKKGHLQIRAINRRIPNLHIKGTYPFEAFLDKDEKPLQESKKLVYIPDAPYLHGTHLKRSSKRNLDKFKVERGIRFPKGFKHPEVLYQMYPSIVPSPWVKRDIIYEVLTYLKTPLVWIKRRINAS